jgi:hypothetical protein
MDKRTSKKPILQTIGKVVTHPVLIVVTFTILMLIKILLLGQLVYGDIPYFDTANSHVNSQFAWGPEQLGTNVRQGLNTFRDALIIVIAKTNYIFFFLKYILPIILLPVSYYFVLKRLGITNKFCLIVGALFPLLTPIFFGDFLTGQSFWIYITLPWVFYYAIKIYFLHQFMFRNNLLFAIMLFLSFGMLPPIIVPLCIVLAGFVLLAFLNDLANMRTELLKKYFVSALTVISFFLLFAGPYLFIASSGQTAYTPPSLLDDYYHNYSATVFANTLRLAGNEGNGQSTLGYNQMNLINTLGYFLLVIAVVGIVLQLKRSQLVLVRLQAGLLTMVLLVTGFMYVMAVAPGIGAKLFESQWVVSTIRNPSKLFVVILPMFTMLFVFGVHGLYKEYGRVPWQKALIGLGVVAIVVGYGWPALRGDFGLLINREYKAASYKEDPFFEDIANLMSDKNTRSLLVPADHHDELNYQNTIPGLNILRLEGGLPGTSRMISELNVAFNDKSRYFFNFLDGIGVEKVFVKKDADAYNKTLFNLFSAHMTSQEAIEFVDNKLDVQQQTDKIVLFSNPNSNPLIFSPDSIVTLDGDSSLTAKAPFIGKKVAVLDSSDYSRFQLTTQYAVKKHVDDNQVPKGTRAQLHDPSLLIADLYQQSQNGQSQLVIDVLDPLTHAVRNSVRQDIGAGETVVVLGEEKYVFGPQKRRITLRAGNYQLKTATLEDIPIGNNSFEKGVPPANDGGGQGKANVYTNPNPDASDGKQSLQLGTSGHLAFTEHELPVGQPQENADYLVSFDYKYQKGVAPRYGIYQGELSLTYEGGRLSDSKDWQKNETFITTTSPKDKSDKVALYFYADTKNNDPSESLFDNLRLAKVVPRTTFEATFNNYDPDYDLESHIPASEEEAHNLLYDASFEGGWLWGGAGDASAKSPGKAEINASKSSDAIDGSSSLKLESKNHFAYVAQRINNFKPNTIYKVSFYYKHISGRKPAFAVWQDGAAVASPYKELDVTNDWTYYETYFVPDQHTTNLTLYFYSRSVGEHTVNLFDNVQFTTSSLISNYLVPQSQSAQKPDDLVINYQRISPVKLKLQMRKGQGMVVFNESYHKGWKATVVTKGGQRSELPENHHVMVNGFANGWWVMPDDLPNQGSTNEDYDLLLEYDPQGGFYFGAATSTVALAGSGGYLVYDRHRRRKAGPK